MNVYVKWKQIHRYRKQTSGYQRGRKREGRKREGRASQGMGLRDTKYYV